MARPRRNALKSNNTTKSKKATPVAEEAVEKTVVETPAEEVKAETVAEEIQTEEVKAEAVVSETAEEVKPEEIVIETLAEPKPKRKYTRRTVTEIKAYIQGAGAERSIEALAEKAKELSGVKSPKSVNLYIKPYEDDGIAKVYYVVDDKSDWFELF